MASANPKAIGGVGNQIVHTLAERGGRARSHYLANISGDTLRTLCVYDLRYIEPFVDVLPRMRVLQTVRLHMRAAPATYVNNPRLSIPYATRDAWLHALARYNVVYGCD